MFKKNIFSNLYLLISFSIFLYTFYRAEIYFKGEQNYNLYYYISYSLIFFSFVTYFFSKKINQYLMIILISVIATLYLYEGYLYFNIGENIYLNDKTFKTKSKIYKKNTGKEYDKNSKEVAYKKLKKKNTKISISSSAIFFKSNNLYALSNVSSSPTLFCNENGYFAQYLSDRYGFNNPDKEWDNSQYEYIVVGDSYGHGACVNRNHDISSVLRTLSNKPVINLSFSGNGPLIEYASLVEYLHKDVKYVIWLYFEGNDLEDLSKEMNNEILKKYLINKNFKQNLRNKQNLINDLVRDKINRELKKREYTFFNFSKLTYLRHRIYLNFKKSKKIITSEINLAKPWNEKSIMVEFQNVIEKANKLANYHNAKLIFVYLPKYNIKKKSVRANYPKIRSIVKKLDIPFISIDNLVFKKEDDPLKLIPFGISGHYNKEGYLKVANTIYKAIMNNNF